MISEKEDDVEKQGEKLITIAEENIPDKTLQDEPSEKPNTDETPGQKNDDKAQKQNNVDEAQDAREEQITDDKMEEQVNSEQNEERPLEVVPSVDSEVAVESEKMEVQTNITIDNNSLESESKDDDDLPLGENRAPAEIQMEVDQEIKEFMDNCKSEPAEDEGYNQNNGMTTIGSIDLLAMSTDDDSAGEPDPEYFASLGKPRVAEKPASPPQSDSQISQNSIPSQSDSQVSQSSIPSLEEIPPPEMDLDMWKLTNLTNSVLLTGFEGRQFC